MSHQNRRDPLPSDYQFPTHGVDCDCPPCRNDVAMPVMISVDDRGMVHIEQHYTVNAPLKFHPKHLVSTMFADGTVLTEWRDDPNVPVITAYGWGV